MVFPIGDDQVQGGHKPIFSYLFIGLNVLIFLYQMQVPGNLICDLGFVPNEFSRGEDLFTIVSSTFLHGGWMHLIGNMLFLWVFADNIEATIGNIPFLIFYFIGGVGASLVHYFLSVAPAMVDCCDICEMAGTAACAGVEAGTGGAMCPGTIPTVGASGAISAVLGAYLIMFPKSKIKMIFLLFFSTFRITAIFFLGFWIVQQLISGVGSLGAAAGGGTAWWAHIGGFAIGVLGGILFRMWYNPTLNRS